MNICWRGHLVKRQAGDAIHQNMALVAPIELVVFFRMLIGSGMYAKAAIGIGLWLMIFTELIPLERLRIILCCVCGNGRRIQSDEGGVEHASFVKLKHLRLHELLKNCIVDIPHEAVKRPVGRQWLHDIEAAVMSDDKVVAQIVHKVGDLRESFALHDDEGTEQSLF